MRSASAIARAAASARCGIKFAVTAIAAVIALAVPALTASALAQKTTWDRKATITAAAERLVVLHRKEGSVGVLKFLDACYKTHILSIAYNAGVEACLAQDYMHSKILAMIYARVPAERNRSASVPSPELITKGLGQRYAAVFNQYGMGQKEALALQALVEKYGIDIFTNGVLPKSAPRGKAKN